jgi:hypothetical protein
VVLARASLDAPAQAATAPEADIQGRADRVAAEVGQLPEGDATELTAFVNGGFRNGGGGGAFRKGGFANGGGGGGFRNGGFANGGGGGGFRNGGFANGGGGGFRNGAFRNF